MSLNNILVTGGAGYVGSHACKALAAAGYTPVCVDNLVYGHKWAVKWGVLEEGSITDRVFLQGIFETYQPIAVMHFAAYTYVGESVTDPQKYYLNNLGGTLNLLSVMQEFGCNNLVFSSTCATYGMPSQIPISESCEQRPINPYGSSKLMVEQVIRDYHHAYGLSAVILRYFNAAGADESGEIGEAHEPETHLIPLVLKAASGITPQIDVYGDDYETADGTCVRDYIHVSDLAEAHVLALKKILGCDLNLSIYNLGTGSGYSVNEIIVICEEITNKNIRRNILSRRDGDPAKLIAANQKAICELKWEPKSSEMNNIIETAWKWHLNFFS